jgi:hypothetical protein
MGAVAVMLMAWILGFPRRAFAADIVVFLTSKSLFQSKKPAASGTNFQGPPILGSSCASTPIFRSSSWWNQQLSCNIKLSRSPRRWSAYETFV